MVGHNIGRFVECVKDNISWLTRREGQHLCEAVLQNVIVGLSRAIFVRLVNAGENFATGGGVGRKLGNKRYLEVVAILLIGIPKMEVEIGHGRLVGFAQGHGVSDN